MTVSPAKTAEPIEMPFTALTRVGQRNQVLDDGPDLHAWMGNFEGKKGLAQGHAWTCLTVDILKATQQGAAPVWCRCQLWCTRWGAHCCHLVNTTTVRVRQQCDLISNYFDHLYFFVTVILPLLLLQTKSLQTKSLFKTTSEWKLPDFF